jgi:hypothetical protein
MRAGRGAAIWAALLLPMTGDALTVQRRTGATAPRDGRQELHTASELVDVPASEPVEGIHHPTGLDILIDMATGGSRRRLQGQLLAVGPAAFASFAAGVGGPATDPEVARFQSYIGTLTPGLLATYGLALFLTICTTACCVSACVYCCCLALLPTEVCMAMKPACCY